MTRLRQWWRHSSRLARWLRRERARIGGWGVGQCPLCNVEIYGFDARTRSKPAWVNGCLQLVCPTCTTKVFLSCPVCGFTPRTSYLDHSGDLCAQCGTRFGFHDIDPSGSPREQRWSELRTRWKECGSTIKFPEEYEKIRMK